MGVCVGGIGRCWAGGVGGGVGWEGQRGGRARGGGRDMGSGRT